MSKLSIPSFGVFVKPWPESLPNLAKRIKSLGFDWIELPVRPGIPVTPENMETELPAAVNIFKDNGIEILSVATDLSEKAFCACAAAGVKLIRICIPIPAGERYMEAVNAFKQSFSEMLPALSKYGITIGLQNHYGRWVPNAMCLRHLVEGLDPKHAALVFDPAHCGLDEEDVDFGIDIVWPYMQMLDLKNAFWKRKNGPDGEPAKWEVYWTSGRQGLISWQTVAHELALRNYSGPVYPHRTLALCGPGGLVAMLWDSTAPSPPSHH